MPVDPAEVRASSSSFAGPRPGRSPLPKAPRAYCIAQPSGSLPPAPDDRPIILRVLPGGPSTFRWPVRPLHEAGDDVHGARPDRRPPATEGAETHAALVQREAGRR